MIAEAARVRQGATRVAPAPHPRRIPLGAAGANPAKKTPLRCAGRPAPSGLNQIEYRAYWPGHVPGHAPTRGPAHCLPAVRGREHVRMRSFLLASDSLVDEFRGRHQCILGRLLTDERRLPPRA